MKKFALFGLLAITAATFSQTSNAMLITAVDVIDFDCGLGCAPPGRDNPLNALGASDGLFYELGRDGSITLGFGQNFTGPTSIAEITFGNPASWGEEAADVFVGNTITLDYDYIGRASNLSPGGVSTIAFNGVYDYMTIIDVTGEVCGTSRACRGDGFDLDSASVTAVPIAGTGSLVAFGLLGARLRRRRFN